MDPHFLSHLSWLPPYPPEFREKIQSAGADGKKLRHLASFALGDAQLNQIARHAVKIYKAGSVTGLTKFRLAILSNATVDHMVLPLIGTALRYGIELQVQAFAYHDAFAVAVSGDARLRDFNPDMALIAIDYKGLPLTGIFGTSDTEEALAKGCTDYLEAIYTGIKSHIGCGCILQTIAYSPFFDFGHADKKISGSLRRVLALVNDYICQRSLSLQGPLLDIEALSQMIGTSSWFDARFSNMGKLPFAMEYIPLYADHVCRVIGAAMGKGRKVLVLDLDNTLWGGVVGDDGVDGLVFGNGTSIGEAFLEFQRKVLSLRNRGILLAVSSKNDESQARRPFKERSDMVLDENAFVAFYANWNDKAANIRQMATELSLGLESFVFVDDNPAERALVREFLPEVAVLELPDDPSNYAFALDAAGYFEAISFSDEDTRRSDLYRSKREMAAVAPNDLHSYLKSLDMRLVVERIHSGNKERVVQLINKSNQFNLTTRRMAEADVDHLSTDPNSEALVLRLIDKFDDHGIISIVIGEKKNQSLDIFLWVMSCRVIGRGVERAVMRHLVEVCRPRQLRTITGTYIPSDRNGMVIDHYKSLGFQKTSEEPGVQTRWSFDVSMSDSLAFVTDTIKVETLT